VDTGSLVLTTVSKALKCYDRARHVSNPDHGLAGYTVIAPRAITPSPSDQPLSLRSIS